MNSDYKALRLDVSSRAKSPKYIEFFEYMYEQRPWHLACVNIGIDSEIIPKRKYKPGGINTKKVVNATQ